MDLDRLKGLAPLMMQDRKTIFLEIVLVFVLVWVRLPPSTTIYLLLLGWLSLRLRNMTWHDIGIRAPENWKRAVLLGVGGGLFYFSLATWGIEPIVQNLFARKINLDVFGTMVGNLPMLLLWMSASWTLAAFGEEMVYRAYIHNRVEGLFPSPPGRFAAGALANSLLFGLAHSYQDLTGAVMSVLFGLVLSAVYFWNKRNLWACILFHGVYNTPGLILIYLGMNI